MYSYTNEGGKNQKRIYSLLFHNVIAVTRKSRTLCLHGPFTSVPSHCAICLSLVTIIPIKPTIVKAATVYQSLAQIAIVSCYRTCLNCNNRVQVRQCVVHETTLFPAFTVAFPTPINRIYKSFMQISVYMYTIKQHSHPISTLEPASFIFIQMPLQPTFPLTVSCLAYASPYH